MQLSTITHNKSVKEDFIDWPEWEIHVNDDIRLYKKWCEYWIKVAETHQVPVLFLRFEDLVSDPASELKKIFPFILGMDTIEGSVIERRIDEVIQG